MVCAKPIFTLINAGFRVGGHHFLEDTRWQVNEGENWAVIGPNGAGKTTLMRALMGQVPVVNGKLIRNHPMAAPKAIGYVSFTLEQQRIDQDRKRDEARYFSGREDDLLRGRDVISGSRYHRDSMSKKRLAGIIETLDVEHLMNREVRRLSTGELRRVFIARALTRSDGLLILDEPFEGIDSRHRQQLAILLDQVIQKGYQIIMVSHRIDEIPQKVSLIIAIKDGRVVQKGARKEILTPSFLDTLYRPNDGAQFPARQKRLLLPHHHPIIDIRHATVRYGNTTIFSDLSWRVNRGEHWSINGPNGSGKTTLLGLITGDHLQAYANEIYLWGKRRGTGESIWEIKNRFGVVSAELQRRYRKRIPTLNVIRSGFFDHIGLYRTCTSNQKALADEWIRRLRLQHLVERRFDQLSFGERKMVLIARAMVKTPEVLILDEPCQGLDRANRRMVLSLVNRIGQTSDTQIIFVTHRPEEVPACTTHHFKMPSDEIVPTRRI